MDPILQCQSLTKEYNHFPALSDFSLTLERGQIVGLLGPSGSGKSTLIKVLTGVEEFETGEIIMDGKSIINTSPQEAGNNGISTVYHLPERTYLNDWMKVREIIAYFDDFYANFVKERALEMLERLGISPDARLRTLSKGSREKVQLILVMSRDADLYILDEPIGGVDPAARQYILSTILSNYNENATILLSTHLIAEIENILDRVLFLQNGQLILNHSVDEIRFQQKKSIDTLFREVFQC